MRGCPHFCPYYNSAAQPAESNIEFGHVGADLARRYTRRLPDKILLLVHFACDQSDFVVGAKLLHVVEMMLTRNSSRLDPTRRKNVESLIAAHERLWHLRHSTISAEQGG